MSQKRQKFLSVAAIHQHLPAIDSMRQPFLRKQLAESGLYQRAMELPILKKGKLQIDASRSERYHAETLIFKFKGSGSSAEKNITLEVMNKYKDLRLEEYIDKYSEEYFWCPEVRVEMTSKAMHSVSSNIHCFHFKEYAEDVFKMIDVPEQYSIFIPQDKNSGEMLQQIKEGQLKNTDKIFKYTAQVTYMELKKMYEEGVVGECDGIAYLKDVTRYDAKTGILTEDV